MSRESWFKPVPDTEQRLRLQSESDISFPVLPLTPSCLIPASEVAQTVDAGSNRRRRIILERFWTVKYLLCVC